MGAKVVKIWRFKRGLTDKFVAALNQAWERKDGWWRKAVEDRALVIGIRDQYLNVYYRGNSMMHVGFSGGRIQVKTHYKYLVKPPTSGHYFAFHVDDSQDLIPSPTTRDLETVTPSELGLVMRNSEAYSGVEKEGVHKIAVRNASKVIDLEVGFSAAAEDGALAPEEVETRRRAADRIDMATIDRVDGRARIVFYEAKDFSNQELRSGKLSPPPVLEQLCRYENYLDKHQGEIEASYKVVAGNLLDLKGVGRSSATREQLLEAVRNDKLTVDTSPRLLVFGFKQSQRNSADWADHEVRLSKALGGRYMPRGDPAGYRL